MQIALITTICILLVLCGLLAWAVYRLALDAEETDRWDRSLRLAIYQGGWLHYYDAAQKAAGKAERLRLYGSAEPQTDGGQ